MRRKGARMTLRTDIGGYVVAPRYAWDPDFTGNGSPAAITRTRLQFGGDDAAESERDAWKVTTWPDVCGFGESIGGNVYINKADALRDIAALLAPVNGVYPYGDGSR